MRDDGGRTPDPVAKPQPKLVVAYLQGFSAPPSKVATLPEELAAPRGAYPMGTRFRVRGQDRMARGAVTANDRPNDAAGAAVSGENSGDRVLLQTVEFLRARPQASNFSLSGLRLFSTRAVAGETSSSAAASIVAHL